MLGGRKWVYMISRATVTLTGRSGHVRRSDSRNGLSSAILYQWLACSKYSIPDRSGWGPLKGAYHPSGRFGHVRGDGYSNPSSAPKLARLKIPTFWGVTVADWQDILLINMTINMKWFENMCHFSSIVIFVVFYCIFQDNFIHTFCNLQNILFSQKIRSKIK